VSAHVEGCPASGWRSRRVRQPSVSDTGCQNLHCTDRLRACVALWCGAETRFWENNPVTSNTFRYDARTKQLWTNVSVLGSLSNTSGRACLRAGLPVRAGVDWSWNQTVSMWWCDESPESQWHITSAAVVSLAPGGGCLTAISGRWSHDGPPPVLPPTPGAPGGDCDPVCPDGCRSDACKTLPFCNSALSFQARALDLISRVPDLSKPDLMMSTAINPPGCLGLSKSWMFFGEAQHGMCVCSLRPHKVSRNTVSSENARVRVCVPGLARNCDNPSDPAQVGRCATSFPSLVGLGATYNRTLWRAMGTAISDEARAWYNIAGNKNNVPLTMWAPVSVTTYALMRYHDTLSIDSSLYDYIIII
jgi:hypothetical protein